MFSLITFSCEVCKMLQNHYILVTNLLRYIHIRRRTDRRRDRRTDRQTHGRGATLNATPREGLIINKKAVLSRRNRAMPCAIYPISIPPGILGWLLLCGLPGTGIKCCTPAVRPSVRLMPPTFWK